MFSTRYESPPFTFHVVRDLMTQIRHIASIVVTYEEADPRVSKAVL